MSESGDKFGVSNVRSPVMRRSSGSPSQACHGPPSNVERWLAGVFLWASDLVESGGRSADGFLGPSLLPPAL